MMNRKQRRENLNLLRKDIWTKLRFLRLSHNLTREQAAELIHCAPSRIEAVETSITK